MAQMGGGTSRGTSGGLQRMIMAHRAKTGRYPSKDIIEGALTAGIKDASGRSVQNRQANMQQQQIDMQGQATMANIQDMRKRRKLLEQQYKDRQEANEMGGIGQMVGLGAQVLPAVGKMLGLGQGGQAMIPQMAGGVRDAFSGMSNYLFPQQQAGGDYGGDIGMGYGGGMDYDGGFDFGGYGQDSGFGGSMPSYQDFSFDQGLPSYEDAFSFDQGMPDYTSDFSFDSY